MNEKETIRTSKFLSLILRHIRAGDMHRAGHVFWVSANGVWLVKQVPPEFIEFPIT